MGLTEPVTPRKPLWEVIDEEGSYNSRPYSYTPRGALPITLPLRVEQANLFEVEVEPTC